MIPIFNHNLPETFITEFNNSVQKFFMPIQL